MVRVMPKKNKWSDKKSEFEALLKQGLTKSEAAEKLGVPKGSISYVLEPEIYAIQANSAEWKKAGFATRPSLMQVREYLKTGKLVENEKKSEGASMAERNFEQLKTVQNGVPRTGVVIKCAKQVAPDCLKSEDFYSSASRVSYVLAAKNFRNRGWIVGKGPRADYCPHCYAHMRGRHPSQQVPKPKAATLVKAEEVTNVSQFPRKVPDMPAPTASPVASPAATAPVIAEAKPAPVKKTSERLGREERRIITEKLDEIYFPERGGYIDDWNDQKVAENLGCDIKWVAEVRDVFFGPEVSANSFANEVKALCEEGKRVAEIKKQIETMIDRLTQMDDIFNNKLKEFEDASKAFQKDYNALMRKAEGL